MNYIDLHRLLCELGCNMGSINGMWFLDYVKLLHRGNSCTEAMKVMCRENHIAKQQMIYGAMLTCVKPVLELPDADLAELGIVLEKRTSSGLAVALEKLLD